MHKSRSLITIALSILIIISIFAGIYLGIWLYKDTDDTQQADVIIVLGAACFNDEPSPVFRERINHGIWLYENGYAPYLIFTGGKESRDQLSESQIAKNYATAKGIPEEVIFIEELSTITEENMQYAKAIMDEQGFEDALIVSDGLHMKRAMLMADDYGILAYPSPTPTTMYQTFGTQFPFMLRETFLYTGYRIVRLFR